MSTGLSDQFSHHAERVSRKEAMSTVSPVSTGPVQRADHEWVRGRPMLRSVAELGSPASYFNGLKTVRIRMSTWITMKRRNEHYTGGHRSAARSSSIRVRASLDRRPDN
jgi:hypothetical protein